MSFCLFEGHLTNYKKSGFCQPTKSAQYVEKFEKRCTLLETKRFFCAACTSRYNPSQTFAVISGRSFPHWREADSNRRHTAYETLPHRFVNCNFKPKNKGRALKYRHFPTFTTSPFYIIYRHCQAIKQLILRANSYKTVTKQLRFFSARHTKRLSYHSTITRFNSIAQSYRTKDQ